MTAPATRERTNHQANRRLGLILASVAVIFALGFVAKIWLFHR